MAFIPAIDDNELVATASNPVAVKFDNQQFEIQYLTANETEAMNTLALSPFNTVVADARGNISFIQQQGGVNIYTRNYLRNWFQVLNLAAVDNNV